MTISCRIFNISPGAPQALAGGWWRRWKIVLRLQEKWSQKWQVQDLEGGRKKKRKIFSSSVLTLSTPAVLIWTKARKPEMFGKLSLLIEIISANFYKERCARPLFIRRALSFLLCSWDLFVNLYGHWENSKTIFILQFPETFRVNWILNKDVRLRLELFQYFDSLDVSCFNLFKQIIGQAWAKM